MLSTWQMVNYIECQVHELIPIKRIILARFRRTLLTEPTFTSINTLRREHLGNREQNKKKLIN